MAFLAWRKTSTTINAIKAFANQQLLDNENSTNKLEECFKLIKRRFGCFSRLDDVTILSGDQVLEILRDDSVNCREEWLLHALLEWFSFNPKKQKSVYIQALELIR